MEYKNSEIEIAIDECIHNAIYRAILKDRLIDGMTYEAIAEKRDYSVAQVKRICYKYGNAIFKNDFVK